MSFWNKFKDFLFKDFFSTIENLNGREQSRKRARNRRGQYVADDKSTKNVNEAYTKSSKTK